MDVLSNRSLFLRTMDGVTSPALETLESQTTGTASLAGVSKRAKEN